MGNLFSSTNNLPTQYVSYGRGYQTTSEELPILYACSPIQIEIQDSLVNDFAAYQDSRNLVLAATSNPVQDTLQAAWESVYPKVEFMSRIYNFCENLTNQIICLFSFILSSGGNQEQGNDKLLIHPMITCRLIQYLSIVIDIDSIKISLPNMLMDLAFFRRVATRMSPTPETQSLYQKSSKISLFLGQGTPAMSRLIEQAKTTFANDDATHKSFLVLLGSFINTCAANVRDQVEDNGICLKAMTAAFLIYDELNKDGAYHSRADFAVLQALTVLVRSQPHPTELVNTLKYSSKHLQDRNTIPEVRSLLNI